MEPEKHLRNLAESCPEKKTGIWPIITPHIIYSKCNMYYEYYDNRIKPIIQGISYMADYVWNNFNKNKIFKS